MGVDLLSQFCHVGALFPFLFILLHRLLLSRRLNKWVIRQMNLRKVPEWESLKKVDNVHSSHLTFSKTKPLSLENDITIKVLCVNKAYVIKFLLAPLHRFL